MPAMKDKIALVTGAGRGIGAATALLLAEEGYKVVLASRTTSELEEVGAQIQAKGGKCVISTIDLADDVAVNDLFSLIQKNEGRLDVLVNNAAIFEAAPFTHFPIETYDLMMKVNVRAPFLLSQKAFQMMQELGGGTIVNISSLAGIRGTKKYPNFSAYTVSKHAIVGLTEALAEEGKPFRIRVNCVAPGPVDTAMLKKAVPEITDAVKPYDIAKIVTFFCTDKSEDITGTIYEVHTHA